jgi:two-component system, LytTR family, response regulator
MSDRSSADNAPITVLIVDDEPPARRGLRTLLEAEHDLVVVGEARSGAEAVTAIREWRPDLVFLDVQMPDGDGFEVVRQIGPDQMPVVIFSTAYDHYALQAFEAHALDYLLKPYDRARLESALARARGQLRRRTMDDKLLALLTRVDDHARYAQRLAVKSGARTHFVPVANVDYFEAEENYVRIHVGDRSWLMRETLTGLAERLDPLRFVRVHRSIIVQLLRVTSVESLASGEYDMVLASGKTLTSGRTYRAVVQGALGLKG